MSSEIRAGDRRTYWIISNGNGYVDGVTDPGLVTTVGNGMHTYWMGTDFQEYSQACANVGIVPRNSDPNTPTTSDKPIVLEPFMIISNLSQKLNEIEEISNNLSDLANKQEETSAMVNSVATTIPGERISASQARVWLIQNGIDEKAAYSAIDSIEDETLKKIVLAKWEYDTYIDKDSEWLSILAPKIGLSSSDLDRAFQEAAFL